MTESSGSLYDSLRQISNYGAPFKIRHKHRKRGVVSLDLLESQIRYAMENTRTCQEAARWLNIDYGTFKKYAKMYIDKESGKSLFDLHRDTNISKRRANSEKIRRQNLGAKGNKGFIKFEMKDIIAGKHPNYSFKEFKKRLLRENILPECCSNCGYSMRRDFDSQVPLVINFRDNNKSNFSLDNVRFLCYNCYFLLVGNPIGANKKYTELPDGTLVPVAQSKRYLKKIKQLAKHNDS